ncbi:glycosyltransferase [Prolixibacter sp. NT017]|uniref:glycosyltransferase family protein n=1 Tax=Prolixibacter sp. NT017 TaxID=2652390 RepID=UPI00127A1B79|nr:glycosyltransferase [Prolixibacter sp. NT017]GET24471.1 hypothetical protein NT017_08000 [Prolixibacter sp. NT017]
MKVLFLSQGKQIEDHPGWQDALEKLKLEGEISEFTNLPYIGYAQNHGWEAFYNEVVTKCKQENYDLVYFHYFHLRGKPSPKKCLQKLLALQNRPVIITSCGDGFSDNWRSPGYPNDFKEISQLADITFSTQIGKAADKMLKWGAKNIVYIPHGMCQVRFKAHKINPENHNFDYDVVFIGSRNKGRNFMSRNWKAANERENLVKALHQRYGNKLGLFGNGWNYSSSQGPVPFNKQQHTFMKGRIIVGGNPYSYSDYYASNRPFFEISSGIPTVELSVPRLNKIFRDGDHVYFENNFKDLIKRVDLLLDKDPNELYSQAAQAGQYIEEKHTQYHRMRFKIDTAKRYIQNDYKLNVSFPFFLPEVNLAEEYQFAVKTK